MPPIHHIPACNLKGQQARRPCENKPKWQQNEFGSSFPVPIGRQTSFGVVETLPARPRDLFQGNLGPQKRASAIYSVVLTTEFVATQDRATLSFRNHYSETRFVARGTLGTTPKLNFLPVGDELRPSLCVIRRPCAPWQTEPVPRHSDLPAWRLSRLFRLPHSGQP